MVDAATALVVVDVDVVDGSAAVDGALAAVAGGALVAGKDGNAKGFANDAPEAENAFATTAKGSAPCEGSTVSGRRAAGGGGVGRGAVQHVRPKLKNRN